MSDATPVRPHTWTDGGEFVYAIKRADKNRKTRNQFVYPLSGVVEPETWEPNAACGGGIHAWPWGMGLGDGANYDIIDDVWIVLRDRPENVVGELDGGLKCKMRRPEIVATDGSFAAAMAVITAGRHRLIIALAASGNGSKLAASGNGSKLAASGNGSKLAASGNGSKLAASGNGSNLAASGNYSKLAASGYGSNLAASGNYSNLAASGNYSNLAASGNYSNLAASGNGSNLAASGNGSNLAASGNYSNLAASGNYSKLDASGYGSNLAASGYDSQLAASGTNAVLVAAGINSTAKAGPGGAICLPYLDAAGRTRFAVGYVGENIKPHTWYRVSNGQLAETTA